MNGCIASPSNGRVAFGGPENDITLWDYRNGGELSQVWAAQNVPHDKLHLRQPVFVSALCFLGEAKEADRSSLRLSEALFFTGENEEKIVSGTGYRQLRLYDPLAGRRPVLDLDVVQQTRGLGDYRITAICAGGRDQPHAVFSGDAAGNLFLWDLRVSRRFT